MKRPMAVAALAALTLFSPRPGFAQAGQELKALGEQIEGLRGDLKTSEALRALGKEIEVLKEGRKTLQKDLQEITLR